MALILKSTAFENGADIPVQYTCRGDDISPPLSWENVPEAAISLVLIVDDPDAPDPDAPKMTWVHWLLYNIPPDSNTLVEHMTPDLLPAGTREGLNDWQRMCYGGPCPPIGSHRYFFKLYALDTVLPDMIKPTKARLEAAMQGHIIEQAQLMGTFEQ
ncbi:MAG: YbhB/YbcL family Raf kinase inhibitor-like protein [Gammaproteobacteria bacterium]|nr:YbhB/YbcL family Raf kinase inhibitor-like protein [Gammaproteobacteria bacterium]